jgi:hypothetical protein
MCVNVESRIGVTAERCRRLMVGLSTRSSSLGVADAADFASAVFIVIARYQ